MSSSTFRLAPLSMSMLLSSMAMMAFVALIGPLVRRIGMAEWVAGLAMAAGGVCWTLLAQWWGRLSDRRGRRPVLLAGLGILALACCGMAVLVDRALHGAVPVWVAAAALIAGRALIGGSYAAVPPTCAAMASDFSTAQTRYLAMAKLGSAMSLGMVLGPAIISWVSGYGLEWGFYATGALPLIALVCVALRVPAPVRQPPRDAAGHHAAERFSLFDRRLRMAIFTSFTAVLSLSLIQICLGFFVMDRLHLDEGSAARVTGSTLAGLGVAMLLAQQLVMRLHRVTVRQWVVIGAAVGSLGVGAMFVVHSQALLLAVFSLGAFGVGLLLPTSQTLAANAVTAREQGRAAGALATFQGLGMTLGPSMGTVLYGFGPSVPYLFAAALLLSLAVVQFKHPRDGAR